MSNPARGAHALIGVKLLPNTGSSSDRYVVPDQRDFFALPRRPGR